MGRETRVDRKAEVAEGGTGVIWRCMQITLDSVPSGSASRFAQRGDMRSFPMVNRFMVISHSVHPLQENGRIFRGFQTDTRVPHYSMSVVRVRRHTHTDPSPFGQSLPAIARTDQTSHRRDSA